MSAEEAVFVQMGRVAALRGYSGQLRGAMKAALNSLSVGDQEFAKRILSGALEIQNPDTPADYSNRGVA